MRRAGRNHSSSAAAQPPCGFSSELCPRLQSAVRSTRHCELMGFRVTELTGRGGARQGGGRSPRDPGDVELLAGPPGGRGCPWPVPTGASSPAVTMADVCPRHWLESEAQGRGWGPGRRDKLAVAIGVASRAAHPDPGPRRWATGFRCQAGSWTSGPLAS